MRQNETISLLDVASGLKAKEVRDLILLSSLLKKIDELGFVLYAQGNSGYQEIHLKDDEPLPLGKRRSFIINSIDSLSGFLDGYESCLKWNS